MDFPEWAPKCLVDYYRRGIELKDLPKDEQAVLEALLLYRRGESMESFWRTFQEYAPGKEYDLYYSIIESLRIKPRTIVGICKATEDIITQIEALKVSISELLPDLRTPSGELLTAELDWIKNFKLTPNMEDFLAMSPFPEKRLKECPGAANPYNRTILVRGFASTLTALLKGGYTHSLTAQLAQAVLGTSVTASHVERVVERGEIIAPDLHLVTDKLTE